MAINIQGKTTIANTAGGGGGMSFSTIQTPLPVTGSLLNWGIGTNGQLGNNTVVNAISPVPTAANVSGWSVSSFGNGHVGAIKTNGTLWTWGLGSNGELGDNTVVGKSSPIQIGTETTWSKITCGKDYKLAIKTNGTLWAWGYNGYGQLGDNTISNRSSPVQIGTETTWSSVSGGRYHTSGVKTNGTLWLWGLGTSGQLGDNTTVSRSSPLQIGTETTWSSVAGGYVHTAAVKTNGTLWCWGWNDNYQLGDGTTGTNRSSPFQIAGGGTTWSSVSCSQYATAAIKTEGTLWTWGSYLAVINKAGLFSSSFNSPMQVLGGGTTWSSVFCGNGHFVALKSNNTLWAWGYNTYGELGTGALPGTNQSGSASPVNIARSGYTWKKATAAYWNSGAIVDIGDTTLTPTSPSPSPTPVAFAFTADVPLASETNDDDEQKLGYYVIELKNGDITVVCVEITPDAKALAGPYSAFVIAKNKEYEIKSQKFKANIDDNFTLNTPTPIE